MRAIALKRYQSEFVAGSFNFKFDVIVLNQQNR
jgi:hypothetical protein